MTGLPNLSEAWEGDKIFISSPRSVRPQEGWRLADFDDSTCEHVFVRIGSSEDSSSDIPPQKIDMRLG